MNPEIKKRWVEALRSGKYAQTTGALHRKFDEPRNHTSAGFCCLGVLREVLGMCQNEYLEDGSSRDCYLSDEEAEAAGLTARHQGDLSEMNDGGVWPGGPPFEEFDAEEGGGFSFDTIAAYIEAHL